MTTPPTGPDDAGEQRAIPMPYFAVVAHGFDPAQVRAYVDQVRAEMARLERDNWDLRQRLDAAARAEPNATLAALHDELVRAMARFEQIEAARQRAAAETSGDEPRPG